MKKKHTGYEGIETFYERSLLNRKITHEQQEQKMANLHKLAVAGFRLIKAIEHDKYIIEGKEGFYNPYTDTFYKEDD